MVFQRLGRLLCPWWFKCWVYPSVNAKYGNDPGVKFYTHISDQFAPFHTKVIRVTASEAAHVLDALLYHESELKIEEHYTDTAGATEHVFALCHLLGFRFVPRIRNLSDRRLYARLPFSGACSRRDADIIVLSGATHWLGSAPVHFHPVSMTLLFGYVEGARRAISRNSSSDFCLRACAASMLVSFPLQFRSDAFLK